MSFLVSSGFFAPARWFSHQQLQKGTLKVNWHIVKYLLHIVYKSILLWAILLHLTLRQSMQFMKVFFFFLSMFLFLVPIHPVESFIGHRSHVPVIIKSIQAASLPKQEFLPSDPLFHFFLSIYLVERMSVWEENYFIDIFQQYCSSSWCFFVFILDSLNHFSWLITVLSFPFNTLTFNSLACFTHIVLFYVIFSDLRRIAGWTLNEIGTTELNQ